VGVRDAGDEVVLASAPQVVGGLAGGDRAWRSAEELGEQCTQVAAGEPGTTLAKAVKKLGELAATLARDRAMLMEMSVMEQRYHAVMKVVSGAPVTEVARRYGASRQAAHGWLGGYGRDGLAGLADHSHRLRYQPWQLDAGIEALICQLRGAHPRWGPRRLLFELGKAKVSPVPSRSTICWVLVRHGLVPARKRKRRRQDYKRWRPSSARATLPTCKPRQVAPQLVRAHDRARRPKIIRSNRRPVVNRARAEPSLDDAEASLYVDSQWM
jgi:transposase